MTIIELLIACDLVATGGQGRRYVNQGAIRIDDLKVTEHSFRIPFDESFKLQIGKRINHQVKVKRGKNDYIVINLLREALEIP